MIPTESAVRSRLERIHPILADASHAAFQRWLKIPTSQRAALDHPRTFANVIWGFFCAEATTRLASESGITLTHKYNTLGIVVDDELMLRFKRVNRQGLSRNYATQTSLRFYGQIEIPGIPATCARAEIGWREDEVRLGLAALEVVMRDGKAVAWHYSILEEGATSVVPIVPATPITSRQTDRKHVV